MKLSLEKKDDIKFRNSTLSAPAATKSLELSRTKKNSYVNIPIFSLLRYVKDRRHYKIVVFTEYSCTPLVTLQLTPRPFLLLSADTRTRPYWQFWNQSLHWSLSIVSLCFPPWSDLPSSPLGLPEYFLKGPSGLMRLAWEWSQGSFLVFGYPPQ